jgi:RNA polymerase sigma-70 factor, ECF subfamily
MQKMKADKELIENAKKNPNSFEQIYHKYADKLFNYFWYRTGHDHALSEDLMQETFLKAFLNIHKFEDKGATYISYLYAIARNLLIDHYRKPAVVPIEELGEIPIEITKDLEKKSDAEALWRAIQELRPAERDLLLLFYKQEMSIKEIAHIRKTTENAVKLSLSRIRKKLSEHPYLQDIRNFGDRDRSATMPQFKESV